MKRILVAASLAAVCALSAPAFAQDQGGSATTPMPAPQATTPDTGTTGSIGADLDAALMAIEDGKTSAGQIQALSTVSTVNVVKVDELATGDSKAKLDAALTENKDGITELQTAVDANSALKAKLTEQKVEATNVVAAKVEADGSVTVFVNGSTT